MRMPTMFVASITFSKYRMLMKIRRVRFNVFATLCVTGDKRDIVQYADTDWTWKNTPQISM